MSIGFDAVKPNQLKGLTPTSTFSIVIPFRNEAQNLPELLKSISNWHYPNKQFEIILIDDESSDGWQSIVSMFSSTHPELDLKVISNERKTNSPKKDAIQTAISIANFDWILTTDADCILPENWLECFDECIQKTDSNLIAGPVQYMSKPELLNVFQELDFLSLQGVTIGGFGIGQPFLCNGANMGYRKSWFTNVNGFSGNENIASGDDIFMLQKAVNTASAVYLKYEHAIVKTNAQATVSELINQRLRWASKTSKYNYWVPKFIGLTVFLMNATVVMALVLALTEQSSFALFFQVFLLKWSIDLYLLHKTAIFFKAKATLKHYMWCSLLYPIFVTVVASISLFMTYKWKGRNFKT